MPGEYIGRYKYYTLDDLDSMIYDARNHDTDEEAWYRIKMSMLDMAYLVKKYAIALYNYEFKYEDDGR